MNFSQSRKKELPKLMNIKSTGPGDIRITCWTQNKKTFYLLCHLGEGIVEAEIDNKKYGLSSQEITLIVHKGMK